MHAVTYKARRDRLISAVKDKYQASEGVVLVGAAFESSRYRYRQDSYFYYLTGIAEPAAILALWLDGRSCLYLPNFGGEREKWVTTAVQVGVSPESWGLDEIKYLSDPLMGYAAAPYFEAKNYRHLIKDLEASHAPGGFWGAIYPRRGAASEIHHLFSALAAHLTRGRDEAPSLLQEVSGLVDQLRRRKDGDEIALIQQAIDITIQAHARAASAARPGAKECLVQAEIERTFVQSEAFFSSFPSIVATGINSTVLHYTDNTATLADGDMLVVDIGAEFGLYAADLTRTYPVGRGFSRRQREIYELVLEAQQEAASVARPGMFLRNPAAQENSLHACTVAFFKKHGVEQYFPHGIGHYMGLDVHDVGEYSQPLAVGDVFTIEPGLYLPEEAIGVRIEDDYLMTEQGAVCLSSALPKAPEELELFRQQALARTS